MPVVLTIRENEDLHSVLLSSKALILGRSSSCDIRLSDERVSGKHLAIKLNNVGRVMIKDLGTTNGTFLNGSQVQESYFMLQDEITLGSVSLKLDDAQLSSKEKKTLTRDDQTQMKYIKLQPQTNSKVEKPKEGFNSSEVEIQDKSPTLIFNEKGEAISPASKGTDGDPAKLDMKERMRSSAALASKAKSGTSSAPVSDELQFEMDKPSGHTQMIQVEVGSHRETDFKKPNRKKKIIKPVKVQKSLIGKIIGFFKS